MTTTPISNIQTHILYSPTQLAIEYPQISKVNPAKNGVINLKKAPLYRALGITLVAFTVMIIALLALKFHGVNLSIQHNLHMTNISSNSLKWTTGIAGGIGFLSVVYADQFKKNLQIEGERLDSSPLNTSNSPNQQQVTS